MRIFGKKPWHWISVLVVVIPVFLIIFRLVQGASSFIENLQSTAIPTTETLEAQQTPSPTIVLEIVPIPAEKLTTGTGQLNTGRLINLTAITADKDGNPEYHPFHNIEVLRLIDGNGDDVSASNWEGVQTVVVKMPSENASELQQILSQSDYIAYNILEERWETPTPTKTPEIPIIEIPPAGSEHFDLTVNVARIIQQSPDKLETGKVYQLLAVKETEAGYKVFDLCVELVAFLVEDDKPTDSYLKDITTRILIRAVFDDINDAVQALDGEDAIWLVQNDNDCP